MTQTASHPSTSEFWNADLAPTDAAHRTWTAYHYIALWIGMIVCIPGYMLAAGLIDQGFSAWQVVGMVFAGNGIVLVPMLLNGHAGQKYAVPFAVLVRSSFGVRGAKLPALLRALVACGWFGIQCWVGGSAIYAVGNIVSGGALVGAKIGWLGIDLGQFAGFLVFWTMHLWFIARGPESVRWIESFTAPIKVLILLALLVWAWFRADGFGELFNGPSQFVQGGRKAGQFWTYFWPSFTAMVGYWSTLAMNIPDFTRFARTQKDQIIGQTIGLPFPMGGLAFVSVAVTSATVTIYGKAIWDPVDLAGRMEGIAVAIGLAIIVIDTLCVNLAANVVGPAYDFAAIFPRHVNFARGGYITAMLGVAMMPWKLIASSGGYIFTWLVGYGALLGPVLGIMIADYWLVRRTRINVSSLYDMEGDYRYREGWNPAALIAFVVAVLPNVPGFLASAAPEMFAGTPAFVRSLYDYAWFIGVFLSMAVYVALMQREKRRVAMMSGTFESTILRTGLAKSA
jgi:NCS1 family nucleobase:cation symporter-1